MENSALKFLEEEVQYIALAIMGILYVIKILWLARMKAPSDKAPLKGNRFQGVLKSWGSIFMPWSMESTRKHPFFYLEFALFHIGVALTIAATFLIPLAPGLMTPSSSKIFMLFIAVAFLIGVRRLLRRILVPEMRLISSRDDYFSLTLLNVFFLTALWALGTSQTVALFVFFLLTTFFLIYVPFSKISHYLYYPFSRFFYGAKFGGRGVLKKGLENKNRFYPS